MRAFFGFDFPIARDERFFPTIAKVGARMAQLFSNTYVGRLEPGADSVEWRMKDVPDLRCPRDRYNFSDGIGTISQDAFDEVCRRVRAGPNPSPHSSPSPGPGPGHFTLTQPQP